MSANRRTKRRLEERAAASAERSFRFWSAARWHRRAAGTAEGVDDAALRLMLSARALQKGETWRTEAASWEMLGDHLGRNVGDLDDLERDVRHGVRQERVEVEGFYVISQGEWSTPPAQHYGDDVDGLRRHHQAQAYEWAGECALAASQFAEAARLYRRAGVAWQASRRTDRSRRAADCYFNGAMSAARSSRIETRSMIIERAWCPSCLRDKSSEHACSLCSDAPLQRDGEGNGTDLDRLLSCSDRVIGEAREAAQAAFTMGCRQLAAIQRELAIGGARADAMKVYRVRMSYTRRFHKDHHRLRYVGSCALWCVSKNQSSVRRLLFSLAWLYLVIIPFLWWSSGSVDPEGASAQHGLANLWESVVFSVANVVAITPGHFEAGGALVTLLQALQALTGYFSLGVALWISQRSYDF